MNRAVADTDGILQLDNLNALPHFRHGFDTRRRKLSSVIGTPMARLKQVHGTAVLEVPRDAAAQADFLAADVDARPHGDALVSDVDGIAVAVSVADCLPVLFADPHNRIVAAAHAGWRGLAGGVIENTIATMKTRYGSHPHQLVVGIGPAIGPCCFEVGSEVIDAFAHRGYGEQARVVSRPADPRPYCNLLAVAYAILETAGVTADNIDDVSYCTMCQSDWLWSFRQDGAEAGRLTCGIALTAC